MLSRLVEKLENPFGQIFFLEVSMPVFVGVNLDYSLFEEGIDFFLGEHIGKRDGFPFWPNCM